MSLTSLTRFLPLIESSALLLCDVQERFRPLIYNMNTVIHKSELVNNVCHALEIPCYISEQNPKALGTTVAEITRYPSTYIYPKTKFSMVTDDLRSRIGDKKQIILCGIESHVCIFQSTLELLAEGRDVFVVTDAVSSQRPYDRAVALETLKTAGATLTSTESLVFALLRDSTHPKFKEISQMIKIHNANAPNEFGSGSVV